MTDYAPASSLGWLDLDAAASERVGSLRRSLEEPGNFRVLGLQRQARRRIAHTGAVAAVPADDGTAGEFVLETPIARGGATRQPPGVKQPDLIARVERPYDVVLPTSHG